MGVIGARTPASWSHPRSGAPRPDNTSRSGNLNGNPSIPLPTPDRCRAIPCHSDRHDDGHGTLPAARRRSPRFPGDGADRTTAGRSNTSSFHDPLLGPHDKAVQRRMRHDPFVQAVSRLRRERVEGMSTKLVDASAEAVDTLAELLHSAGRPSDRKSAASVLLGQASRSHGITVEHETTAPPRASGEPTARPRRPQPGAVTSAQPARMRRLEKQINARTATSSTSEASTAIPLEGHLHGKLSSWPLLLIAALSARPPGEPSGELPTPAGPPPRSVSLGHTQPSGSAGRPRACSWNGPPYGTTQSTAASSTRRVSGGSRRPVAR